MGERKITKTQILGHTADRLGKFLLSGKAANVPDKNFDPAEHNPLRPRPNAANERSKLSRSQASLPNHPRHGGSQSRGAGTILPSARGLNPVSAALQIYSDSLLGNFFTPSLEVNR
jgi:hypothetical protein